MYPFLLDYSFKTAVWGGKNIGRILNLEEERAYSEAVMLSFSENFVKNGDLKGSDIKDVIYKSGKKFLGKNYPEDGKFPFKISLLDAFERMPVTVSTKDRIYYISEAKADSEIIFGFSHDLTKDEIVKRISGNVLYSACNCLPVKAGQFILVPEGTLHALGKNIVAYYISSSNENLFTVSDYGRTDKNGKRLPLQINEAVSIMDLTAKGGINDLNEDIMLYPFGTVSELKTDYATVSLLNINGTLGIGEPDSFSSVIVTSGELVLSYASGTMNLKQGDSVLIPADSKIKLTGFATILYSRI